MLRELAYRFPKATHGLFVDPDWRPRAPDLGSLQTAVAQQPDATVFPFRVYDRNGRTARWLDWCFALLPGVAFRYVRRAGIPLMPSRRPPRSLRAEFQSH